MEMNNKDFLEEGEESGEKKSKLGLIIGIAAAVVLAVGGIAVACVMLLGGGEEPSAECTHIDADDMKCDKCGEAFDDGLEYVAPKTADVKFTVKVVGGGVLRNVKFTVTKGNKSQELISDADGNAAAELQVGTYTVSCDAELLPEYHLLNTYSFTVSEDTTEIEISIMNNAPDGTAKKPYPIGSDVHTADIAAGGELFYSAHGSDDGYIKVVGENIVVKYNGQEYTPAEGVVSVKLNGGIDEQVRFSVKNNGTAQISVSAELVFPLGSSGNPIKLDANSAVADITAEGKSQHYIWVADKDGILLISSENPNNNISATNNETMAATAKTDGGKGVYVFVKAGEIIAIDVSFTDDKLVGTIDFSLAVYAGTEAEPVPVVISEIDIILEAGASITYSSREGKYITISNANVKLTNGSAVKEPDDLDMITYTLSETGVFTITNTSKEKNSIKLILE